MPVKADCPHCHISLAIPSKYAGTTVGCPQCNGEFNVPAEGATADASSSAPAAQAAPVASSSAPAPEASSSGSARMNLAAVAAHAAGSSTAPPAVSAPPPPAAQTAPPAPPATASSPAPPAAPAAESAPATAERAGSRTAKFVGNQGPPSNISVAEDGHLPALSLEETEEKQKKEVRVNTKSPYVLTIALAGSFCLSLLMLVLDSSSSSQSSGTGDRQDARYRIQQYLIEVQEEGVSPETYQTYLRNAQMAYARGRYEEEAYWYRQVMRLLHAERPTGVSAGGVRNYQDQYLTGHKTKPVGSENLLGDEDLKETITEIIGTN